MSLCLKERSLTAFSVILISAVLLTGCSASDDPDRPHAAEPVSATAAPFVPADDGSNYLEPVIRNIAVEDMQAAAAETELTANPWGALNVPTCVTRIGETWFIADCYHNQIIYRDGADALSRPLTEWNVMTADATQPHTIAGDGTVFLIDDTENNRVLVFERVNDVFLNTQTFWNIGVRPHYTAYDPGSDTWYVWSSMTGELYLFRRAAGTTDVYQTEIRRVDALNGIYVRSFTILGERIYFVSGVPSPETPDYRPAVYCCDLDTMEVIAQYPVPDSLAGMSQLFATQSDAFLISISTDAAGDQNAAALIRTKKLSDLMKGDYEDIYSTYFAGGGTPYYMTQIDNNCYLTEHRLRDHALWRFQMDRRGNILDIQGLY